MVWPITLVTGNECVKCKLSAIFISQVRHEMERQTDEQMGLMLNVTPSLIGWRHINSNIAVI